MTTIESGIETGNPEIVKYFTTYRNNNIIKDHNIS